MKWGIRNMPCTTCPELAPTRTPTALCAVGTVACERRGKRKVPSCAGPQPMRGRGQPASMPCSEVSSDPLPNSGGKHRPEKGTLVHLATTPHWQAALAADAAAMFSSVAVLWTTSLCESFCRALHSGSGCKNTHPELVLLFGGLPGPAPPHPPVQCC